MSKKSIIICLSIIGVFLIVVAAAVSLLYSGTGRTKDSVAENRQFMLLSAVPSDASAVLKYEDMSSMLKCIVSGESSMHFFTAGRGDAGSMASFLEDIGSSSSLYGGLMDCPSVLSVHDLGKSVSLLLIDAGKSGAESSEQVSAFLSAAQKAGMAAVYADGHDYAPVGSPVRKRSLILVSPSDILVESALRHLKSEVSVLDRAGVPETVMKVSAGNMVIVPDSGTTDLASHVLKGSFGKTAGFISDFAGCAAFEISAYGPERLALKGKAYSDGRQDDFMNIYSGIGPASAAISSVLPSYTIFAASVPLDDVQAYLDAYLKFAGTRTLVRNIESERSRLKKASGYEPADWAAALGLEEVAVAGFKVGGKLEKVILARLGRVNFPVLFKGITDIDEDDFEDLIRPYAYKGYLSSLFGNLFSTEDESSFIVHDGWLIAGSRNALSEYTEGRATEYPLSAFFSDASVEDKLSGKNSYFVSYLSLTEDAGYVSSVFSPAFLKGIMASTEDISYEPAFFTVHEDKSGLNLNLDIFRTTVLKSQAPTFERDTEVIIPEGPFRVKNSGTGKWNLFYQQENLYLCLQEEGGKGLWGVPFDAPICGCAQTVDYFANGKLQILFASGSRLHLIDRLGRFVNPFPVELGKPVLVGPDVYDFSGRRKYNVMILHTDNTIEMYNLQGRRPPQWKTITAAETIKGLPERIKVGGSTYWVVRTSIQTLIFGFYGGEPLTDFSGDRMIRPDSEVTPAGDGSVEVLCYDGRKHTVRLTGK